MYHFVYCTENLVNGKMYVGVHSTLNMNDDYVGSGVLLLKAVKKHGRKNFRRHILIMCESKEEALKFERLLVDECFASAENTYNVALGGIGGNLDNTSLAARARSSNRMKRLHAEGRSKAPNWLGRSHRSETKEKIGAAMKIAQAGTRNSQSGKVWVSNHVLKVSKRVRLQELELWLTRGWVQGRKMKWK